MGLVSRLRRLLRSESSASASAMASAPRRGASSLLSTPVSGTALSVATVYRCVRLISESVANLPLEYLERNGDGIFETGRNRAMDYLLSVQPEPHYNAFDFWTAAVQQVLLRGNAYIIPIYKTSLAVPDRLALCGIGTVTHDTTNDTYTVSDTINGISGTYREDEVIHLKGLTIDGKTGVSVIEFARLTLGIAQAGDSETLTRFVNGGNVRGIISNDRSVRGFGEYQDEQLSATAENIDDRFQAGERIVSLPGQVDFKQISLTSADMQFLESRKFTVREICRFFGVHPSFVFDDTSNNYKSAEMANVAFLSNTLNPMLRRIETELLRKLVAPGLAHKRRFAFDRRGLYACDLDSRVRYQTQTIAAGIYTVNEWRRAENKAPVDGGDKVLVSANLRGIDEVGAGVVPANDDEDNNNSE